MKDIPLDNGSGSNNHDNSKQNHNNGFRLPDHGLTPDQLAQIQSGIDSVIKDIINNPPAPVEPQQPIEEKASEDDGAKFFQELRDSIKETSEPDPTDKLPFVMKEGTKGTLCNLFGDSVSCHLIYENQDQKPNNFVKDLLKFTILITLSFKETKAATQQYLEASLEKLFSTMPDMEDITFKAESTNAQKVIESSNSDTKLITAAKLYAGYDDASAQLLQLALDKKNIDVIKEQRELFARGCEETCPIYTKSEAYEMFDELTGFDSMLSESLDAKEKYGPLRLIRSQAKRSGYGEPTIYKAIKKGVIPEGAIVRQTDNCTRLRIRDAAVDFFMPRAGIRKRNNPKRKMN